MPTERQIPVVGNGSGLEAEPRLFREELQLAFRNKAIPLEALRYDVTPTGLHYTLIHYDIPYVDATTWRLAVGGSVRRAAGQSMRSMAAQRECAAPGCFARARASR